MTQPHGHMGFCCSISVHPVEEEDHQVHRVNSSTSREGSSEGELGTTLEGNGVDDCETEQPSFPVETDKRAGETGESEGGEYGGLSRELSHTTTPYTPRSPSPRTPDSDQSSSVDDSSSDESDGKHSAKIILVVTSPIPPSSTTKGRRKTKHHHKGSHKRKRKGRHGKGSKRRGGRKRKSEGGNYGDGSRADVDPRVDIGRRGGSRGRRGKLRCPRNYRPVLFPGTTFALHCSLDDEDKLGESDCPGELVVFNFPDNNSSFRRASSLSLRSQGPTYEISVLRSGQTLQATPPSQE